MAGTVEARGGRGGHGHGGRGHHGRAGRGHRGPGHRGRHASHYGRFVRRGWFPGSFTWGTRTWNPGYGCYVYSQPDVPGYYYLSDDDNRYYPVSRLAALKSASGMA